MRLSCKEKEDNVSSRIVTRKTPQDTWHVDHGQGALVVERLAATVLQPRLHTETAGTRHGTAEYRSLGRGQMDLWSGLF